MYRKVVAFFPGNRRSYLQNSIFVEKKDEWNPILMKLKDYLKQKNVDINTYDVYLKRPADVYIFHDVPYIWNIWALPVWKMIFSQREKNILITHETPSIVPYEYMKPFHIFFRKVYTWNDEWVDNKKYFKFHIPKYSIEMKTPKKEFKNKKFLILINSNKLPFPPLQFFSPLGKELFSERMRAVDFFEKRIPDKFSLYGRGWNKPRKYSLLEPIFGFKKHPTYKGEVGMEDKIDLLSNFKYCIAFENLTNVEGYITEKMFDCFKARCVPIYWGATNVEKYIPKECFIDFRDFDFNYERLLNFLNSIDEVTYNHYIKNIEKLLSDKEFVNKWFDNGFVKFFLEDILEIKSS